VAKTTAPEYPKVGRNDPCPCGSGKIQAVPRQAGLNQVSRFGRKLARCEEAVHQAGGRPLHPAGEGFCKIVPAPPAALRQPAPAAQENKKMSLAKMFRASRSASLPPPSPSCWPAALPRRCRNGATATTRATRPSLPPSR
jgi:hypothetical protein